MPAVGRERQSDHMHFYIVIVILDRPQDSGRDVILKILKARVISRSINLKAYPMKHRTAVYIVILKSVQVKFYLCSLISQISNVSVQSPHVIWPLSGYSAQVCPSFIYNCLHMHILHKLRTASRSNNIQILRRMFFSDLYIIQRITSAATNLATTQRKEVYNCDFMIRFSPQKALNLFFCVGVIKQMKYPTVYSKFFF